MNYYGTTVYRNNATELISQDLKRVTKNNPQDYVFLCIGVSKVVSDGLGPKVGSLLKKSHAELLVYGTEDFNVNASNLSRAIEFIRKVHPDKKLVVVDSAVGDATEVGCVQILTQGIAPGAATNKTLPKVGDLSLIGVVSMRGAKNFYQSDPDRVALVDKLASVLAESVEKTFFKNVEICNIEDIG